MDGGQITSWNVKQARKDNRQHTKGTTLTPGTQTQTASDLATEAVIPFLEQAEQMIFVISAQWDLLITMNS